MKSINCQKFRFRVKLRQKYFSKIHSESKYPTNYVGMTAYDDGLIADKCSLQDYKDIYLLVSCLMFVSDRAFIVVDYF